MRNSVIIAAMAAAAVTTFALPAAASSVTDRMPTEVKIQVSQADPRDQSAESVYLLLRRTAREACDSASRVRRIQREDRACAARTLDEAVAKLNRPYVTARHQRAVGDTRYATGY
jgi:UrcA family protein